MKKSIRNALYVIPVLGIGLASGYGYAETIRGEVVEVNQGANFLRVNPQDQQSGLQKEVHFTVSEGTTYKGAQTLQEINVGDQITLDADKKDDQNWEVKSIEAQAAAETAVNSEAAGAINTESAQDREQDANKPESDATTQVNAVSTQGTPTGAELSQKTAGSPSAKNDAGIMSDANPDEGLALEENNPETNAAAAGTMGTTGAVGAEKNQAFARQDMTGDETAGAIHQDTPETLGEEEVKTA